jgi:hypothetical protein
LAEHASERGAGAVATVIAQLLAAEAPAESTTLDMSLNAPAAVGAPVIAPVDELSVRPEGRPPAVIE